MSKLSERLRVLSAGGCVLSADEGATVCDALNAMEAALREISRLGWLVSHDLQGRVEGGKLAAVARLAETADEALAKIEGGK